MLPGGEGFGRTRPRGEQDGGDVKHSTHTLDVSDLGTLPSRLYTKETSRLSVFVFSPVGHRTCAPSVLVVDSSHRLRPQVVETPRVPQSPSKQFYVQDPDGTSRSESSRLCSEFRGCPFPVKCCHFPGDPLHCGPFTPSPFGGDLGPPLSLGVSPLGLTRGPLPEGTVEGEVAFGLQSPRGTPCRLSLVRDPVVVSSRPSLSVCLSVCTGRVPYGSFDGKVSFGGHTVDPFVDRIQTTTDRTRGVRHEGASGHNCGSP